MEDGRRVFAWLGGYEVPLTTNTVSAETADELARAINEEPNWSAEVRDAFGGSTTSA